MPYEEMEPGLTCNPSAMLEVADGDVHVLEMLLGIYREDTPIVLDELLQGYATNDAMRVERAAHRLVGTVGLYDAADLHAKLTVIEQAARQCDFGQLHDLVKDLPTALDRLGNDIAFVIERERTRANPR